MERIISMCGLVCTDCPAYLATRADDDDARRKVAGDWSREGKPPLLIEDINCDGCQAIGGRSFIFCRTCAVRRCGPDRNVENCAHCSDFPCETLEDLWETSLAEEARKRLHDLRKNMKKEKK